VFLPLNRILVRAMLLLQSLGIFTLSNIAISVAYFVTVSQLVQKLKLGEFYVIHAVHFVTFHTLLNKMH